MSKQNVNLEKAQPYLREFLEDTANQKLVQSNDLLNLGKAVLNAKAKDIEDRNGTLQGRDRERIPKCLDPLETALLLLFKKEFRIIRTSDSEGNGKVKRLAMYKDGIYTTDSDQIMKEICEVSPTFDPQKCYTVLHHLKLNAGEAVNINHEKYLIPLKNGIYDTHAKVLLPFTPDCVFLTKLAVAYNPQATNPTILHKDGTEWDVDSWIGELAADSDVQTLIWQVIRDCITISSSSGKAVIFYSESGNNGKGTLGQLIKNILGKGNYSAIAINEFKNDTKRATIFGKAANIADENDTSAYLDSAKDFKACVTADDIIINDKYEKAFAYQFFGANIQMMNGLPRTKDKTDSLYRRIILVPFLKSFTNNGECKYIKEEYIYREEVLEYVLKKALEVDFDEYIVPQVCQELLGDFKEDNNPVLQFWKELEPELKWDLIPIAFLYDLYVSWVKRTNPAGRPTSRKVFKEDISKLFEKSDVWLFKNGTVNTGKKMDADEPLITEYNLVKWMDSQAASSPPPQQRAFVRANTYRSCLVRL
ncbi:phage/plasmid primase, P4 family [Enterococcus faecalis]|uniref:DNA primase family protein n=1 Tax=Enterococcus faecalis TaxID=1351 RepID=UPI0003527768|nr:phage/plasmid primase, P4 family [Enterococcus faecalis]EPI27678.1 phage/plasmid primase, P4 family domain protein [Enterococcus faecalis UP2S-6]MEB8140025.1 phage/plasmid primase, P4 family [Enterococcus faecalis]NSV98122.1 hypothetical protein [Enterococcus faecalis]TQB12099.1 hypothetical protein FKY93_09035 [Enterococcus faecalis]